MDESQRKIELLVEKPPETSEKDGVRLARRLNYSLAEAQGLESVVRMFTSGLGTVRWETSLAGDHLEFKVSGPLSWSTSSIFPDAVSLMRHQSEYERFLLDSGYELSHVEERRRQPDRRRNPRDDRDRRRNGELTAI